MVISKWICLLINGIWKWGLQIHFERDVNFSNEKFKKKIIHAERG